MSDFVTVRVKINDHSPISKTLRQNATVDHLKRVIRQSQDVPAIEDVVLKVNNKYLKCPDTTLSKLEIPNGTIIQCVISGEAKQKNDTKKRANHEEQLMGDIEDIK